MVTNYPHLMTASEGLQTTVNSDNPGILTRMADMLRQTFCGLGGHDTLLRFEDDRIALRCASCGHETPGWELNEAPPTVTVRGDARRHMLAAPQLVRARCVA